MKGGFLTDVSEAVPGEGEYEFKEKPKACGWWNGYSALCLRALEEGVLYEPLGALDGRLGVDLSTTAQMQQSLQTFSAVSIMSMIV